MFKNHWWSWAVGSALDDIVCLHDYKWHLNQLIQTFLLENQYQYIDSIHKTRYHIYMFEIQNGSNFWKTPIIPAIWSNKINYLFFSSPKKTQVPFISDLRPFMLQLNYRSLIIHCACQSHTFLEVSYIDACVWRLYILNLLDSFSVGEYYVY